MGNKCAMSDSYLDRLEMVIGPDGDGVTPRECHARLGFGSRESVRAGLRGLVSAGRVRFEGPDGERRYWRVGQLSTGL